MGYYLSHQLLFLENVKIWVGRATLNGENKRGGGGWPSLFLKVDMQQTHLKKSVTLL